MMKKIPTKREQKIQQTHDPEIMATGLFRRHPSKSYHYIHRKSKQTFKLDTSSHAKTRKGEWGLESVKENKTVTTMEDNTTMATKAGRIVERLDATMAEWSKEDADKWAAKKADPKTAEKRAEVRKAWNQESPKKDSKKDDK